MNKPNSISFLIISLYFPWLLSSLLKDDAVLSYFIAWLGSFFIFYQTWSSSYRFVLPDLPIYKQIMRPLFLQQLIFAGFMCCSSIFYFLNHLGYQYFEKVSEVSSSTDILLTIAKCQRMSLLAHAALVNGILLIQRRHINTRPLYQSESRNSESGWLIKICVVTFFLSVLMERISGLYQFSIGLYNVAIFSGSVILVKGIRNRKTDLLLIGGSIFLANLINSTLTGYKEHILVNFIILFCLLFPYYKKTVIITSIPLFLILFYVLPTYAMILRSQSWGGETSVEDARSTAVETILSEENETLAETNWIFLTNRLSEINMFTQFVESTPNEIPYYGLTIISNSLQSIIPRVLWTDKPITENLAMERVYNAAVVDSESNVSAKTRPVVDGYLSAGLLGVFIYMLSLGALSQAINNIAENLFGGYEIGCIIFFNGFYQTLWRGETTEFMVNSIFWSFVMMLIVFRILKAAKYIKRVRNEKEVLVYPRKTTDLEKFNHSSPASKLLN